MLCKECVLNNRTEEMIRADRVLDMYLNRTADPREKKIIEKILSGFRKHQKKRASRDTGQFIKRSAIT